MSDTEINNKEINRENYVNCNLELGDVIEIQAPDNKDFHEQTFYILYIDDQLIDLTNIENESSSTIRLDEDGNIKDESIESITILSRSDDKGFARQQNLLPKTWVDVYFGGETPVVITGEITNLEEDMIEITTYPDLDVIYLDFGFKGIPKNLPIEEIIIRTKPASLDKIESLINVKENIPEGENFDPDFIPQDKEARLEYQPSGEFDIELPEEVESEKTLKDELQTLYNAANEITYGEDLDDIERDIEIPEEYQRHGVETQVNDMLDVLLSEIPDVQRTQRVIDNIHHLILRFKELRSEFSLFDEHNNIYDKKINGVGHKPLSKAIMEFDTSLKWILPVVTLKKKIYTNDQDTTTDYNDILKLNISKEIIDQATLQDDYYHNRIQNGDESQYNRYQQLNNQYTVPFDLAQDKENFLVPQIKVNGAIFFL